MGCARVRIPERGGARLLVSDEQPDLFARITAWLRSQVETVPAEIARCEYDCQSTTCDADRFEGCERRGEYARAIDAADAAHDPPASSSAEPAQSSEPTRPAEPARPAGNWDRFQTCAGSAPGLAEEVAESEAMIGTHRAASSELM